MRFHVSFAKSLRTLFLKNTSRAQGLQRKDYKDARIAKEGLQRRKDNEG